MTGRFGSGTVPPWLRTRSLRVEGRAVFPRNLGFRVMPRPRDNPSVQDAYATRRVDQEIVRLAHTRSDSFALRRAVAERLCEHVPFDAFCWWTTDPATMFLTTSVADWMPSSATCLEIHRNEYVEPDFNKFCELTRAPSAAATLERATSGRPARSRRYREIIRPDGFEGELRASQVVDRACWGALALYRKRGEPAFDDREAGFIARLGPHLAEGLRTTLLAAAVENVDAPDAPGLVMLDAEGCVTAVTAGAARWLGELGDGVGHRLPEYHLAEAIYAVAALARSLELEQADVSRLPRARVRADSGEWLLVHAARLERGGRSTGEVAVMIELARPVQIASLLVRAHRLSERETDVVKGVLQGLSTDEIARTTNLSPYTVQDYLKSVFRKVGVRSRRELVGKVFAEQHWPHYGDGDAKLGPDGWFAEPLPQMFG
jgi:DNA-binding CsgD family transcriptional regulator